MNQGYKEVDGNAQKLTADNAVLFWGGPYSQWASSQFEQFGITFNCAEQYMMYQKALLFKDYRSMQLIMDTSDPARQKSLGKQVKGFDLAKWTEASVPIVVKGNYLKFTQNYDLLQILIRDRRKFLVEASKTDEIWGIGLDAGNPDAWDVCRWRGTNKLGFSIMVARARILEELEIREGKRINRFMGTDYAQIREQVFG